MWLVNVRHQNIIYPRIKTHFCQNITFFPKLFVVFVNRCYINNDSFLDSFLNVLMCNLCVCVSNRDKPLLETVSPLNPSHFLHQFITYTVETHSHQ